MVFIEDINKEGITLIAGLAAQVWEPTYRDILSAEQLEYMFDMMYSTQALERQLATGHHFIVASGNNVPLGFASYEFQEGRKLKVHKIYVLPEAQGKRVGHSLLEEIASRGRTMGATKLSLNVNRFNKAYQFYLKEGFENVREENVAIGNGYLMEDYVMEKPL